jgi:hypothetical protein
MSREIASLPEPEAPARLTNQLLKLARGLAAVRRKTEVSENEMLVVRRVAADTIPALRVRILKAMHGGIETTDGLASEIGLSRPSIERHLEDLSVLGAVSVDTSGKPYVHRVARLFSFLSPMVTPEPHASSADGSIPAAAPALFPADEATSPDYLRHTSGNELCPDLTGMKNVFQLDKAIRQEHRDFPDKPSYFVARAVQTRLKLTIPEEQFDYLNQFAKSILPGMDP